MTGSGDWLDRSAHSIAAEVRRRPILTVGVAVAGAALVLAASGDTPAAAAERFVDAATRLDGLQINDLTCDAKRDEVLSQSATASGLFVYFGLPAPQSSTKAMTYDTVSEKGDEATVHVRGHFTAAILGFAQTMPVDATFLMRREDGQWKFCGEAATPPVG